MLSSTYSLSYMGSDGPRQARGMQLWTEIAEELNRNEKNIQWMERFGYKNFTELLKANAQQIKDSLPAN